MPLVFADVCVGVNKTGGYDAIFAILLNEKVRADVESLWCSWHKDGGATRPRVVSNSA